MERTLKVLRGARQLISKRENWTQRTAARDSSGVHVSWESTYAARFCAVGAIARSAVTMANSLDRGKWGPAYHEATDALAKVMGVSASGIPDVNDRYCHAEVLAAFDRAIAIAEEQTEGTPLPPVEASKRRPVLV